MTQDDSIPIPRQLRKGRGALENPEIRYHRHAYQAEDDGWWPDEDLPPLRTQVSVERPRRVITTNTSPDLDFDRSINPYRGCEHGCIYCFARPSHAYLDLSPGLDFETRLIARPDAPELLVKELSSKSYKVAPIAIGTNTDAYQPIEKQRQIMRRILQVLSDFNHPVAIVTKGTLIERDLDILAPMAAQGLARVGISVTTLDPDLSRRMEPRVPSPRRRLHTIRRLAEAGVPVRVMASPMIPKLSDHELEPILQAARDAGARHATYSMLRLPQEVSKLFQSWLKETFPDRATGVMRHVRETHGGKDYDPQWGVRMTGQGVSAALLAQRFRVATARLGLLTRNAPLKCDLFQVPYDQYGQLSLL